MTVERIVELLKASGADAWELTDTRCEGWEFYFIRRRLDQNRAKLTRHIRVKVYRSIEDGKYLGSAAGEIPPTADEDEARRAIAGLIEHATYVKNPFYTLNAPKGAPASAGVDIDPMPIARDFIGALGDVRETATEDVNSCELFVNALRRRFVNSEGIDVESVYPSSMAEVVVNARDDAGEIELYRMFTSGSCDRAAITRRVEETMRIGRDKLTARPTPNLGKADVLFTGEAAKELYDWFASRMSAAFKVFGYSDWEIGQPVVLEARGDRVTLRALKTLPNSSENAEYDAEGAPIRDEILIEDGVARRFLGSRQFSQYLNLEDSFIPGNLEVAGGTATSEALRQGCFLEAVEFSDFQVDPVNGDIAGEIRLAYWHDGEKVVPVSGGSVSGSMAELARDLRMSAELVQYDNWRIPALTRLGGVTVAGE